MLKKSYQFAKRLLFKQTLPSIVHSVRSEALTYLNDDALGDLFDQVKKIEKKGTCGIFIEAGCALGGSAIVIATAKSRKRPFYVYDVFGLIPPPSENDDEDEHERYSVIESGQSKGINGNIYYGYEENLFSKVAENFRKHNVSVEANNIYLVQGLFQDTLRINEPVALAHLDCDWYESIMTCLNRIEPYLTKNGVLVIDDYYAWSGCRKAVDEYFSDKKDKYKFIRKSRLHIIQK